MQRSKPLRLRGLKYIKRIRATLDTVVEAFAASWIEIMTVLGLTPREAVEAFAASWIEIFLPAISVVKDDVEAYAASWIEIKHLVFKNTITYVEAYAASWIEISGQVATGTPNPSFVSLPQPVSSRSLCGFVD